MILVTGAAGFIGFHLCSSLIASGLDVLGIDNLNDYYSVSLKESRLKILQQLPRFNFRKIDITNKEEIFALKDEFDITHIINLAAQPGVRYSTVNPYSYVTSNVEAHVVMLELARKIGPNRLKHFVFASSSSVYGDLASVPFNEDAKLNEPKSLYAATKLSQEHIAYCYASQYKIPATGLRFFTVYGPFGRPDMAVFSFVDRIYNGKTIDIYQNGTLRRDFTYIDDIIFGIRAVIDLAPKNDVPYEVYNLGNNSPVSVNELVSSIEDSLGKKAIVNFLPKPVGDVDLTYADITKATKILNYIPKTSITEGISKFIDWYLNTINNS